MQTSHLNLLNLHTFSFHSIRCIKYSVRGMLQGDYCLEGFGIGHSAVKEKEEEQKTKMDKIFQELDRSKST